MRSKGGGRAGGEAGERRAALYEDVTKKVIADLEGGCFPWVQPWGEDGGGAEPGLPCNALTGRPYSGINILLLWSALAAQCWPTQRWLTFQQALGAGGCVRKGEHGVTIFYADRFVPRAQSERAVSEEGEVKAIPFLKRFTVFNIAQCEGLGGRLAPQTPRLPDSAVEPVAEALIAASGADFRVGGDRAFYAPGPDCVVVPPQAAFFAPINYYRTAFHELTHWTGHRTRLARDFSGAFGSDAYAREELVAEMGAAFLCAALGIVPTVRHADYLGGWLSLLRGDSKAVFRAASAASRAADYLLRFAPQATPDALASDVRKAA